MMKKSLSLKTLKILNDRKLINRKLPANFDLLSSMWQEIFKEIRLQEEPEIKLLHATGLEVDANSILWSGKTKYFLSHHEWAEILMLRKGLISRPELIKFFSHPISELKKLTKYILTVFQIKPLKLLPSNRSALLFWDRRCTVNPYHWFVDALVRLTIYMDSSLEKPYLIIPKDAFNRLYVLPTIELLGFNKNDILVLESNARYFTPNLKIVTPAIYSTGACSSLAIQSMRKKLNLRNGEVGEFVYLARKTEFGRNILNEKEFENLLRNYGFKKVFAEDISFNELKDLMRRTKVLIGAHGAALANMVFMPTESCVIEIANEDIISKKPDYWDQLYPAEYAGDYFYSLSIACGMNYNFIPCERNEKKQATMLADILVNLSLVEKTLTRACLEG